MYVARVKLISVLPIRNASYALKVLIFSTDNTTVCQKSNLMKLQWDPLSLRMKKLQFFESFVKIYPAYLTSSKTGMAVEISSIVNFGANCKCDNPLIWQIPSQAFFSLLWAHRIVRFWVPVHVDLQVKVSADVAARESAVNRCPAAYPRLVDDSRAYFFVPVFMRVSKIAENLPLALSYPSVCKSALCLSVSPHGRTRLSLDGFSWNLVFDYFWKVYPKKFRLH
jgi:hypothetical protein